jgi:hypothetical protein
VTIAVSYPKATDPNDPRVRLAVEQAQASANGVWGRLNPYWLARSYIVVQWRGRYYRACHKYRSMQGTSTVSCHFGEE